MVTVPQWIPFAFGTLILVWAVWSVLIAFTGTQGAGLHRLAPPPEETDEEEAEREQLQREERRQWRQMRLAQISNYVIAIGVLVAAVAMVVAALVIGH